MSGDLEALQNALYREKVERARRMTVLEKFEAGQGLFEIGCLQMLGNIRGQQPDGSVVDWHRELRRRLAVSRRIETLQLKESYHR